MVAVAVEEVGSWLKTIWTGLPAGLHTVSLWARVANGSTASTVIYDPGCWSSDHVTIKEYLPFGSVALPAILRE